MANNGPRYVWAQTGPSGQLDCYKIRGFKKQYCSLHGDFIGWQVMGGRIRSSGLVSSTTSMLSLSTLTPNSRDTLLTHSPHLKETN